MNGKPSNRNWFPVGNPDEIESPALLIYPERVEENLRRMVAIAGDSGKLRPHVKTHKLAPVVTRTIAAGILKFKAATLAEVEMSARAGAADVLLAYQPVGPNVRRFIDLAETFPGTALTCLVDDLEAARELSGQAAGRGTRVRILLDVDCGQHRTGIAPGKGAIEFYRQLCRLPGLYPAGLHAYDGHIRASDAAQRKRECDAAFLPVALLRDQIRSLDLPVETLVLGGTPTFPFHAVRPQVECSPGTCVLWDFGSSSLFPDLDFLPAALALTRVISKPDGRHLCLDLGYKSLASESPPPRVHFLNAPSAREIAHSEEHLVIEVEPGADWKVGDSLYGVPWHICPTVALHAQAVVIEQGRANGRWPIDARNRQLHLELQ